MSEPTAIRATRYLTVALRWLVILAGVFILTIYAGNYVTEHILPQVYTADATLQVPASDLVVPTAGSRPEPVAFQPEFENTIRSPDFLLSIIKDLNLEQEWGKRIFKSDDQLPDVDALTHMEDVLTFKADPATNTVIVTAASDVPVEAARIANAVADRYKIMREAGADTTLSLGGNPVHLVSRAETPIVPTHPNKHLAFIVTMVGAGIVSLLAASFVEIVLLFVRASSRMDN